MAIVETETAALVGSGGITQKPRLHILHLSRYTCSGIGGVQTYLSNLSAAFSAHPISSMYAAIMPGDFPPYAQMPPFQGRAGIPQWANILRLLIWLHRNVSKYDVVHIHNAVSWQALVGGLVSLLHGVPYVISPHGALYPWTISRRRTITLIYLKTIGGALLRRAAAILATTTVEARVILSLDKCLRVKVASPGIAVPNIQLPNNKQSPGLQVVFLGRLEQQKGLPILLEAVSKLHRKGLDARLSIIGTGEVKFVSYLKVIADRLNISHATTFHGPLTGKAKLDVMCASHVFALPSYMENFSFATAEALACGLPVVVSEEVALADTIIRYRCGTVVPIDDASALANGLAKYQDVNHQRMCALNAYNCAVAEFSTENMGQTHSRLYREVSGYDTQAGLR